MRIIRIHSCADDKGFFVDVETNDTLKCAFELTQSCYSNCAACEISGTGPEVFCNRGVKDNFYVGSIKED